MAARVFVSFSHSDVAKADLVVRHLEKRGVSCWIDTRDIPAGSEWADAVASGISDSSLVVMLLGLETNRSRDVLREMEFAVSNGKPVLTVKIADVQIAAGLSYYLSAHQWVEAVSAPFADHLDWIEAAVIGMLGDSTPTSGRSPGVCLPTSDTPRSSAGPQWSFWRRLWSGSGSSPAAPAKPRATGKPRAQRTPDAANRGRRGGSAGFDVFLCYRRREGAAVVRLIRNELHGRGWSAFLDVEDLGPGHYDDKLLKFIGQAPNFVPILTDDCLSRNDDNEDWMLKEIACAIATERNIVPLVMPGFRFPNPLELPAEIRGLPRHNGVEFSNAYYQSMIERLLSYLVR